MTTADPPVNTAAWITAKHARLEVGPAPYPRPGDDQILLRNHAVAVNPLDWIIQVDGSLTYGWLTYPTVLGADVAGEVVEVGKAVTRFRPGDRVLAAAVGTDKDSGSAAEGAFQLYTVALERMASPIPDSLPFERAAVLPLAVCTAACGLFQTAHLGLNHPAADAEPTGRTVLIWGGSTSVGSNAIQLAVAAGYEVITTASPHNFDYVTKLGAAQVFDYKSPSVVPDVIKAFHGRTLAGAIAIGPTAAVACVRIAASCTGKKFVSVATPPVDFATLVGDPGRFAYPRLVRRLITSNVALQIRSRSRGVGIKYIFATAIKADEVSAAVFRDFLPAALATGRYVAAPEPFVAGRGVDQFQCAMDVQAKGVSAAKVVITLP